MSACHRYKAAIGTPASASRRLRKLRLPSACGRIIAAACIERELSEPLRPFGPPRHKWGGPGITLPATFQMFVVVGSGPAGVACAHALLSKGARVTMLDAGLDLESDRKAQVANL